MLLNPLALSPPVPKMAVFAECDMHDVLMVAKWFCSLATRRGHGGHARSRFVSQRNRCKTDTSCSETCIAFKYFAFKACDRSVRKRSLLPLCSASKSFPFHFDSSDLTVCLHAWLQLDAAAWAVCFPEFSVCQETLGEEICQLPFNNPLRHFYTTPHCTFLINEFLKGEF